MPELIWNNSLCAFIFRKLIGIAAHPVIHSNLHGAGRQKLLKARLFNMPCGEAMIGDERGSLGISYRQISVFQRFAIECTEVATHGGRGPLPRAECLLTADIDRQSGLQLAVVFSQEAGEAAEMIVVTVTEHEGIELGRLNAY